MAAVSRLALTNFRSYASALVEPQANFILLFGENGAGKTNVLEAVSMLAPGRGLRGAPLLEMARRSGDRSWAVAARLERHRNRHWNADLLAPERRQVRINSAPASVNSLSEWLSVLWVTPAMDRLFVATAGERRRFLDRLVLALEPSHAHHATRYDAAMRARNKLLTGEVWDEVWLSSLESAMEEHGRALFEMREFGRSTHLTPASMPSPKTSLRAPKLHSTAGTRAILRLAAQRQSEARSRPAGRTIEGPHRQDLIVVHRSKQIPAASSSTGEQKALLLGDHLPRAPRSRPRELRGKTS